MINSFCCFLGITLVMAIAMYLYTPREIMIVDYLNKEQLPIYEKEQMEKQNIWYRSLMTSAIISLVLMLILKTNKIISN